MYREEIKVLDCTIRDGGLINNHYFTDEFVREAYKALSKSGIDYMEFGYRNSKELFPTKDYGAWKYCDDDKISEIIDGIESNLKISIMVDAHRVKEQTFAPCHESPVDMIRVATYVKDIDKAIDLVNRTSDLGYETTVNIMAISKESEPATVEALDQLAKTAVDVVYVVDSFGALYCEPIEYLVKLYREHLPGKEVGIHCHNNQQLAFGNTIEGIIHNANYVDGSLHGIGRGPGNCCLELLVGFLKNPKFNLSPILKFIQEHMLPLREEIEWGYIIPYMVTGILNEHPRSGIAYRQTDDKDKYAEFYEQMLEALD
ncbi:MAG: aldolase catalytic domain-containing protein [Phycisphaerales bacterium]|nr:MAG: aldolase catalytic domain-containing protein [Phycisphaerales bacterium]